MKKMAITKFKAYALKLIAEVAKTHEGIIITKRGKPLAQLMPFTSDSKTEPLGRLKHTLVFEDDIITPVADTEWEASH